MVKHKSLLRNFKERVATSHSVSIRDLDPVWQSYCVRPLPSLCPKYKHFFECKF